MINLEKVVTRKPVTLKQVKKVQFEELREADKKLLRKLPSFSFSPFSFTPTTKLSPTLPFKFLAKVGFEFYYVNREGYDYPRYVARLAF